MSTLSEKLLTELIKEIKTIGLGESINPEDFGALEHLDMTLQTHSKTISELLVRIACALETLAYGQSISHPRD